MAHHKVYTPRGRSIHLYWGGGEYTRLRQRGTRLDSDTSKKIMFTDGKGFKGGGTRSFFSKRKVTKKPR